MLGRRSLRKIVPVEADTLAKAIEFTEKVLTDLAKAEGDRSALAVAIVSLKEPKAIE
jgi:hypothetical protein